MFVITALLAAIASKGAAECTSNRALTQSERSYSPWEPTAQITWAIEAVRREDADGPCYFDVVINVAHTLLHDGQALAAAKLARKALQVGANPETALSLLGAALDKGGDFGKLRIEVPAECSKLDGQKIRPVVDVSGLHPPGEDIALRTCTYLDDHALVSCNPRGTVLRHIAEGHHVLWARSYALPSGKEVANASVSFCVGSSCRHDRCRQTNHISEENSPPHVRLVAMSLALNGMPFMRWHRGVLAQTGLDWDWYVVEGPALGRADARRAYSMQSLSNLTRPDGSSIDGTSEYLTWLAQTDSRVHYISARSWRDKLAMVNRVLESVVSSTGAHPVVLMQLDLDELWHANGIAAAARFVASGQRECAFFDCHFLIGPNLATAKPGYGHSDDYEWVRMWYLYEPWRAVWVSHAPPILAIRRNGQWHELTRCAPHHETRKLGAVFTHHAYVTEDQVEFKARFYGYPDNAVSQWRELQAATPPVRVGDYLKWVDLHFPETFADRPDVVNDGMFARAAPIILAPEQLQRMPIRPPTKSPHPVKVVIDGVCFQRPPGMGIRRVWSNILARLVDIVVLRRGGSTLPHTHLETWTAPPFADEFDRIADRLVLAMLLPVGAVLVSTEYTSALSRTNILVVHDVTPEKFGWPGRYWLEKRAEVESASAILVVSNATATALEDTYQRKPTAVVRNGVDLENFQPASANASASSYVLWIGPRAGYKNGATLIKAYEFARSDWPRIWFVGGPELTTAERRIAFNYSAHLDDRSLAIAYSKAVALVYLSLDEGFGLPVLEAFASGCPVVASKIPALVELLGDPDDTRGLIAWVDPPQRLTAVWHAVQSAASLASSADRRDRLDFIRSQLRARARVFGHNWDTFAATLMAIATELDATIQS